MQEQIETANVRASTTTEFFDDCRPLMPSVAELTDAAETFCQWDIARDRDSAAEVHTKYRLVYFDAGPRLAGTVVVTGRWPNGRFRTLEHQQAHIPNKLHQESTIPDLGRFVRYLSRDALEYHSIGIAWKTVLTLIIRTLFDEAQEEQFLQALASRGSSSMIPTKFTVDSCRNSSTTLRAVVNSLDQAAKELLAGIHAVITTFTAELDSRHECGLTARYSTRYVIVGDCVGVNAQLRNPT